MDRKQSIDKVKQKLINNLNLENQSLVNIIYIYIYNSKIKLKNSKN